MNLLNFNILYPDEAACKAKWKELSDSRRRMYSLREYEILLDFNEKCFSAKELPPQYRFRRLQKQIQELYTAIIN